MTHQDFLREWRLDYPEETVHNQGEELSWANGTYIRVRCPFCKEDKKLGPDKGHHAHVHAVWFKCQRCGTKGGIERLLGRSILTSTTPRSRSYKTISQKPKKLVDLFGGPASKSSPGRTIWLGNLPSTHPAWQYLKSEKFTEREIKELLENFPMHVCLDGKPMTKNEANTTTGRLIFTVLEKNQQIGWQARWLPKNWPPSLEDQREAKETDRYITSPGFRKSYTLYNIDNALKWDTIIVVEGAKKVHKLGLFSVATFGVGNDIDPPEGMSASDTNQFWINRLIDASKAGREIWFLYDKDGVGKALLHSETINERGGKSSVITLEPNKPKDVDNYFRAEHMQLLLKKMGRLPKRIKT